MKELKKYKIAVVDDDPIVRTLIHTLFMEVEIFGLQFFKSGEEFLKAFRITSYDAIVLDHDFQDVSGSAMSGTEVLKVVRKKDLKVPVVMLTGQENMQVALDLVELSVSDYIQKTDLYYDRLYDSLVDGIEYGSMKDRLKKTTDSLRKMKVRSNVFLAFASSCVLVFIFSKIF